MGEEEREIIGDLSASTFLDAALSNAGAPHPICIGQTDELIRLFFTDWTLATNVSSLKMIALAWGSLRVSTLLARMGLVIQAPPVQRQAIESVAYAVLFKFDSEFHDVWKSRHLDEALARRFKREGWARALVLIKERSENLESRIRSIYESLIDLGAHPNVLALFQMSEYRIESGSALGSAYFSQVLGQPNVDVAHINSISGYNILIESLALIWPDQWAALQLSDRQREVRLSSIQFIKSAQEEHAKIGL
jgi:hypothetical protein